jgi:hypothetical protein
MAKAIRPMPRILADDRTIAAKLEKRRKSKSFSQCDGHAGKLFRLSLCSFAGAAMNYLEFKAQVDDENDTITGIAWPFGSPDSVNDTITKGAFGALDNPLPMLFEHDPNEVVGIWDSAVEGDDGLQVKGRLLRDAFPRADEIQPLVPTLYCITN